jgi:CO dehydrogenase maturation factor
VIITFLGKGGTGKSTLSSGFAKFLHQSGKEVLAVDADHNMDLSFNLGLQEEIPYIGSSYTEMLAHLGLPDGMGYAEAFLGAYSKKSSFTFGDHTDNWTKKFSKKLEPALHVMVGGPQTDTVLSGKNCSHSLTSPLKLFLPLLDLTEKQIVVVDEKAGADGVSTGIITGADIGCIVCENTPQSKKTAKQIADLMSFFKVPYIFVGNKIKSQKDVADIETSLGVKISSYFTFTDEVQKLNSSFENLYENIKTIPLMGDRKKRTLEKFEKNKKVSD